MADFCTRCAKELGFKPDIDLAEIGATLQVDHYIGPYLCEGCGYLYVANEKGDIKIQRDGTSLVPIEEFLNTKNPEL